MTPVLQTVHGPTGNCYAACVASILGIAIGEVPDLLGDEIPVRFFPGCGKPLRDASAPRGTAIAGLRVLDGSIHSVVCRDGRIVHDPSPRPFASDRDAVLLWTVFRTPNHA